MPIAREPRTCALLASLLLAVTQLASCWDSRCGPGERHAGAVCIPIPDGGGEEASVDASRAPDAAPAADAGGDGAPPDGAAPGDAAADADESGLGKICTAQEQCTGSADFCAIQPGTPEGYCTFKDCAVGGSDCPAPYICIDLSAYLPGLTACIKV